MFVWGRVMFITVFIGPEMVNQTSETFDILTFCVSKMTCDSGVIKKPNFITPKKPWTKTRNSQKCEGFVPQTPEKSRGPAVSSCYGNWDILREMFLQSETQSRPRKHLDNRVFLVQVLENIAVGRLKQSLFVQKQRLQILEVSQDVCFFFKSRSIC